MLESPKCFNSVTSMVGLSEGRAVWLARNVLPHERILRAWLARRQLFDLDVDDIVQETYAKLAALPSVDAIREPRSYLFQVANSVVLGHIRHSRVVSISAAADLDQFGVAAPDPSPEEHLEYRDELRVLASVLGSLPAACRAAFALRRISGLSQKETAQRLGVSEKTVEKYMAKTVRLLMDSFGRGGKLPLQVSRNVGKAVQSDHDPEIVEPGS